MRLKSALLFTSAILAFHANVAHANLIKNGGFESNVIDTSYRAEGAIIHNGGIRINDWVNSKNGTDSGGYDFLMKGSNAHEHGGAMRLHGYGENFFKSPSGGNFFASDPDYGPGTLKQYINGLEVGTKYTLTFEYALAQQYWYEGANNNVWWEVGFGGVTQNTTKLSIPERGFSGWKTAAMEFTATSTDDWLSFLSMRTSSGGPPFMLLDNVKLEAELKAEVPEPASSALMLAGLGMVGFLARRRRNGKA
ncbi:PEP-CTERM sorting domain-containing protein [Telluria beijingensis]|uniref:PEP-CTERM sorting domain-containing protein n=1 Tax=Telluria beijingensis TaxID=3068633 RepID=UPI0027961A29|nr:PEP-CTERM sorting domain-containing protein [Massilia sp. REN29]